MPALTIEPMQYHGPGWLVGTPASLRVLTLADLDDSDYALYELWAPREESSPGSAARAFWQASWTRIVNEQRTADTVRGLTAADALSVLPDDDEGRDARRILLDAAKEA